MKIRAKDGKTTLYGERVLPVVDETDRYYLVSAPSMILSASVLYALPRHEWEPVPEPRDVTAECEAHGVNLFHKGKRITRPTDFTGYSFRLVCGAFIVEKTD